MISYSTGIELRRRPSLLLKERKSVSTTPPEPKVTSSPHAVATVGVEVVVSPDGGV
jgi:hypothetical protein